MSTKRMGSKTSKSLLDHQRTEVFEKTCNAFICDDTQNKSVNLPNNYSKNKRNVRKENKYFRARSRKASPGNAAGEEEDNVESDELLGDESTNKTNSLQRHHLQVVSPGESVNCVPLPTF